MKTCPKCHEDNLDSNRNCIKCGASLSGNPQSSLPSYSPINPKLTAGSSQPPQNNAIAPVTHQDYGENRVSFLNGIVIALSTIIILSALIGGIATWIDIDPLEGLFIIFIGIAVGSLTYLFLSCFVYLYSNIAIIAKNSQIQATYIQNQVKQLNDISLPQNNLSAGMHSVSSPINHLSTAYKTNQQTADAQSTAIADSITHIEESQAKLIANQEQTVSQMNDLRAAAGNLYSHSTAAAEADSSFKAKILSIISEYRTLLENLPTRLGAPSPLPEPESASAPAPATAIESDADNTSADAGEQA